MKVKIKTSRHIKRTTLMISALMLTMLSGCDQFKQKESCVSYFGPNDVGGYQLLDDGVAFHHDSGTVWYRCPAGQYFRNGVCQGQPLTLDWTEANLFAVEFSENSSYQWRLPTADEFKAVTVQECINPALNTNVFPQLPIENYWTFDRADFASSQKCLTYSYQGSIACRLPVSEPHMFMLVAKP